MKQEKNKVRQQLINDNALPQDGRKSNKQSKQPEQIA
jgi:hypothetical protein